MPIRRYLDLLGRYLRPQWRHVALLGVLLFASIGLQLTFPQILRRFIDAAQAGVDLGTLAGVALLYLAVAAAAQAITTGEAYVAANVGQVATNAMRSDLTLHCLRLDMAFHNTRTPGELIERIDGDVGTLGNFFSRFVVDVLGNVLLLAGVLILLWTIDWRLGLAFTLLSLGALAVLRAVQGFPVRFRREARQASAELYGLLEERLAGTEDIRSSGAVPYAMRRFFERARTFFYAELKGRVAGGAVANVAPLVITLFTVISFVLGAHLFLQGEITLGTVFLLLSYTQQLRRPIEQLNRQAQDLANATASIGRIEELFAERSALADGRRRLQSEALSVAFDGVTFEYPDEGRTTKDERENPSSFVRILPSGEAKGTSSSPILHDISFHLAPGRALGLLGRTGSGKTTISRLLLRLYDPTAGSVRLGGIDLRQAQIEDVRRRVGVVTQEVQLFHASVRDNLTFFDKAIPDHRLLEVLRELELWSWYELLPNGLDTKLGPGGGGLSAGEAQLLAFVRVFLKDPGLVILDEASARLDPATERRIERAVDRLLGKSGMGGEPSTKRTAVVIAHRLSTIRRVDEILLLREGCILEHGARAALEADSASQFSRLLRTGLAEALV